MGGGGVASSDRAALPKGESHRPRVRHSRAHEWHRSQVPGRHAHAVGGRTYPNFEYAPPSRTHPGGPLVVYQRAERWRPRYDDSRANTREETSPDSGSRTNGDFFDRPFLERRAAVYGLDLRREIGFYNAAASGDGGGWMRWRGGGADAGSEYRGRTAVHLDAFCWMKRDSYLPRGSRGPKAVTKRQAWIRSRGGGPRKIWFGSPGNGRPHMARYSVSDAVVTYYLLRQVHSNCSSSRFARSSPWGPKMSFGRGAVSTKMDGLCNDRERSSGVLALLSSVVRTKVDFSYLPTSNVVYHRAIISLQAHAM